MKDSFIQSFNERLSAANKPWLTPEEIAEIDIFSQSMAGGEMREEDFWNIYIGKLDSIRDIKFLDAVNEALHEKGQEPLSEPDVDEVLKYRNAFELTGQNVWDGTRSEHYAKWIINRRTPAPTPDTFFVDRVMNHLQPILLSHGLSMLMRYRVEEIFQPYYKKDVTPHDMAKMVCDYIVARLGGPEDEYRMVMGEAAEGSSVIDNEIKFRFRGPDGNAPYMRTLTSFSGADAMLVINGVIVGEAQEIYWHQTLKRPYPDGYPVHGHVVFTMFDREPIKDLIKRPRTTMGIIFANEYGQRAFTKITNPEFTHMIGGLSVDHIISESRYFFHADDVEMLQHDDYITADNGELNPVFDQ